MPFLALSWPSISRLTVTCSRGVAWTLPCLLILTTGARTKKPTRRQITIVATVVAAEITSVGDIRRTFDTRAIAKCAFAATRRTKWLTCPSPLRGHGEAKFAYACWKQFPSTLRQVKLVSRIGGLAFLSRTCECQPSCSRAWTFEASHYRSKGEKRIRLYYSRTE